VAEWPIADAWLIEEMTVTKVMSLCFVVALMAVSGCDQKVAPAAAAAAPAKSTIGIHPFGTGDPNFKPDYATLPPDLQKVFAYIDSNIDEHAENIQKWIRQPSISNSGEGIPESAEMVKGFFEKPLGMMRISSCGCRESATGENSSGNASVACRELKCKLSEELAPSMPRPFRPLSQSALCWAG